MKTKIYLACFPQKWGGRFEDVVGFALGEDGKGLASHLSSNVSFSKHDMGLTSNWKHEHYAEAYPDGYELIWIDDAKNDERWQKALALNKGQKDTSTKTETTKSEKSSNYRHCDTEHLRDYPDCFEECDNDVCAGGNKIA